MFYNRTSIQRYEIALQKYASGSLNFTDFINAQLDNDRGVTDYVNNLHCCWSMYYLIRRLTLFNFENNKPLVLADHFMQ